MQRPMPELIDLSKKLLVQGVDIENVLIFLRECNCSKIMSMKVIMAAQGINLSEAKRIVHTSRSWSDVREKDDRFQDMLIHILEAKADMDDLEG